MFLQYCADYHCIHVVEQEVNIIAFLILVHNEQLTIMIHIVLLLLHSARCESHYSTHSQPTNKSKRDAAAGESGRGVVTVADMVT